MELHQIIMVIGVMFQLEIKLLDLLQKKIKFLILFKHLSLNLHLTV